MKSIIDASLLRSRTVITAFVVSLIFGVLA